MDSVEGPQPRLWGQGPLGRKRPWPCGYWPSLAPEPAPTVLPRRLPRYPVSHGREDLMSQNARPLRPYSEGVDFSLVWRYA